VEGDGADCDEDNGTVRRGFMSAAPQPDPRISCAGCGALLGADALSCPECRALVYAEKLEQLALQARAATDRHDLPGAYAIWKQVLALLPPETRQYRSVDARLAELSGSCRSRRPRRSGRWPAGQRG